MKKLIVEEVNAFRAEVRQQARASGQVRRAERFVDYSNQYLTHSFSVICQSPAEMRF